MVNKKYKRLSHEAFQQMALKDPEIRAEFDELMKEFDVVNELLRARKAAKMTQLEVALKMGTSVSSVSRLEAGGGDGRHSPSLGTLRKYAAAVGCELEIKLVPAILNDRSSQDEQQ